MSTKALENKAEKKQKFRVRQYTRCQLCGRSRAAAGPELFIASLRFAAFVLELWLTKEKYRELKKPVGK